jgi:DNA-binding GntR family transcriptional regulator
MESDMAQWQEIAEKLRRRVRAGEWGPGERLPSHRVLTAEYGLGSTHTVTNAIRQLICEGVLAADRKAPAKGTWVPESGEPAAPSSRDRVLCAKATGATYTSNEGAVILSAELIPAGDAIACALGIDPGSTVIRRHRVTLTDGVPYQRSISHMPGFLAELIPALLVKEPVPGGTITALARVGKPIVGGTDQYAVPLRGASADEAAELQIPEGTPVQAGRNWWRTVTGEVVEYGQSCTLPGRWQTIEWGIPTP